MSRLFVGICNSQDYVPSDFFWSLIGQVSFGGMPTMFRRFMSSSTSIRNNRLIREFIDSGYEYLARLDIDQIYPRDYFKVMIPLVEKYGAIGPLIHDRMMSNDFIPLVNWLDKFPEHPDVYNMSGIIEVPYSHTNGFFHRDVLKDLPRPYFEEKLIKEGLGRENMDRAFTEKITKAGHKLYVNLDMVVKHITTIGVGKEFYKRWHK